MKKTMTFFLLVLVASVLCGQAALNPLMEGSCSNDFNEVPGWTATNPSQALVIDWCASDPAWSIPNNQLGYQFGLDGTGFIAVNTDSCNLIGDLSAPMVPGELYSVQLGISKADDAGWCNPVQIVFGKDGQFHPQNSLFSPVVYQTNGWYSTQYTFLADSAYDQVLIGNLSMAPAQPCDDGSRGSWVYLDQLLISSTGPTAIDDPATSQAKPIYYDLQTMQETTRRNGYLVREVGALRQIVYLR